MFLVCAGLLHFAKPKCRKIKLVGVEFKISRETCKLTRLWKKGGVATDTIDAVGMLDLRNAAVSLSGSAQKVTVASPHNVVLSEQNSAQSAWQSSCRPHDDA